MTELKQIFKTFLRTTKKVQDLNELLNFEVYASFEAKACRLVFAEHSTPEYHAAS